MIIEDLIDKKLIDPPKWLKNNTIYLTVIGSVAYGVADSSLQSDVDIYGICIPPKKDIFPHSAGLVYGFDDINVFEQFQKHHIFDSSKEKEYDINVYSIVKFFKLLLDNNPSCIDTLFTPQECILHMSPVGQIIRENRKLFLHKGCWAKYKGYSYSMLHKMNSKTPEKDSKRFQLREKYGFDVKFGMHIVRLLDYAEQILSTGDLDLRKNKEQLKAIRRGEMSSEEIIHWASAKELQLENLYHKSDLPIGPNKDEVRSVLLDCIKVHYGSLEENLIQEPDKYFKTLLKIKESIEKTGI